VGVIVVLAIRGVGGGGGEGTDAACTFEGAAASAIALAATRGKRVNEAVAPVLAGTTVSKGCKPVAQSLVHKPQKRVQFKVKLPNQPAQKSAPAGHSDLAHSDFLQGRPPCRPAPYASTRQPAAWIGIVVLANSGA
jgi:hypothetical protein